MLRGLVFALALSGCVEDRGPYAPSATGPAVVDGLTLGHRLLAAGEAELALKEYTRAAGDLGLTTPVLAALGSANLTLGRLGQAEPLLRKAVANPDATPETWNNLGVVLMERGNAAEATEMFRRGFALSNGENEQIRQNLTIALEKMNELAYSDNQVNTGIDGMSIEPL
ncbi:MAG: hypothetical protein ACPGRD_11435 [Planktomarina sp.]